MHPRPKQDPSRGVSVLREAGPRPIGGAPRRWCAPASRLLLVAGLVATVATGGVPAQSTSRYNIVVIMADDLSVPMLDDAVSAGLMPNLKSKMIDVGIEFTESFVTNALCCPSRATFLTGQYTHNHGAKSNGYPLGGVSQLDDTSTVATWLHDAGYTTGFVGKYLNGYGLNSDPSKPNDNHRYVPPGWSDWQALTDPGTYHVYNYDINHNGTSVHYGNAPADYQTDVLAARAATFLRSLPGSIDAISVPFFLWITPLAPHHESPDGPCYLPNQAMKFIRPAPRHQGLASGIMLPQPPSFNEADLSDKPAWLQNQFLTSYDSDDVTCLENSYRGRVESLIAVDDLVGRVFAVLEARRALANTIVVFTSDNGYLFGEHRMATKVVSYEESIRVPLYVRVPGGSGRRTESAIALNNDLAPTIAELAGVQPGSPVDGKSLVPFLRGEVVPAWRNLFLVEGYKIVDEEVRIPAFATLRTGPTAPSPNIAFVSWVNGELEFYDIGTDPLQLTSTAESLDAASLAWLSSRRTRLRACAGATCQSAEIW